MKHYGAVDDPKDITTKEYVDAADNALKVKVDALWDFVCTDITSNPFQITFDDLEGLLLLQAGGRRHRHSGQDLRRQQRPRHNQRRGGEILRQATDTRGHTSGPM